MFQYGPLGGSISNFRVKKVRKVTLTAELTAGQQSPIPNLYFNLFNWQLGNAEWNILKESWLKSMDTHPISYSGMSESQVYIYIYNIYIYTHTHTIFSPCCGMKGMSHFRSLWHTLVHCMHSIQHRSLKSASPCTELPRFLLGRGAAGSNSGINGLTSLARDEVHNLSLTDSPGYFLFTLLVFITSQSFLVPGATCFRFERHFCTGKRYAKYEGDLLQTLCAF